MHRLSTYVAVSAMLYAFVSAPLLHVHNRDDDHSESLVHAHFPETEHSVHAGYAIESNHSPHGRAIDLFAVSAPESLSNFAVAELSQVFSADLPVLTRAVFSVQSLRAHSPPHLSDLPPRSPPAL